MIDSSVKGPKGKGRNDSFIITAGDSADRLK